MSSTEGLSPDTLLQTHGRRQTKPGLTASPCPVQPIFSDRRIQTSSKTTEKKIPLTDLRKCRLKARELRPDRGASGCSHDVCNSLLTFLQVSACFLDPILTYVNITDRDQIMLDLTNRKLSCELHVNRIWTGFLTNCYRQAQSCELYGGGLSDTWHNSSNLRIRRSIDTFQTRG